MEKRVQTDPPDAAFTLSEMAISLFLAAMIILVVAEVSRQVARSYLSVRSNLEYTRNNGRIALWLSQIERSDPQTAHFEGGTLEAQTGNQSRVIISIASGASLPSPVLNVQRNTNTFTLERNFTLSVPAQLVWVEGAYMAIDFQDPLYPDFVQRIERSVPYDCQFDFVSRRCR